MPQHAEYEASPSDREQGNLKAFSRMDGAPILSIEIAQNKAYTALFGVSTQDFSTLSKVTRRCWRVSPR